MPYLDWKTESLTQQVSNESRFGSQLTLNLSGALIGVLATELRELFAEVSMAELRIDLPQEWKLFWKARDTESRLLIARPEQAQWVMTLALERSLISALLGRLEGLRAGESVNISSIGSVGSVSNAELKIQRQGE